MRNMMLGALVIAALGANEANATPAWCNVEGKERIQQPNNNNAALVIDKQATTALYQIVTNMCAPDRQSLAQASEIEQARQAWSKRLAMTDADWTDAAAYAAQTNYFTQDFSGVFLGSSKQYFTYSRWTPIEQFIAITNGIPNSVGVDYGDWTYLADALGTKLSETGRFAYVRQCMQLDNPVLLAICDGDIKRLDRAKLLAEVRADARPPADKMKIRILLAQLDDDLAAYQALVKKWRDRDPAYAQMFDIAAKTRGEWDKLWTAEPALIELALAMDDARESRSKKALDGCTDKTRAAWKQAVSGIPASRFVGTDPVKWIYDSLAVVIGTPRGYLAGVALFSCARTEQEGDQKDLLIHGIGRELYGQVGLRGPRFATQTAIMSAGLSLDEAGAKIAYPTVRHDRRFSYGPYEASFGTIAKVGKPDGAGMVKISFAKKVEKQERCTETRATKHIGRVMADGTLIYDRDCVKWGVVAIDKTPGDQLVHARYLEAVKPGVSAYVGGGAVLGVFAKGKKTPIAVFGAAVK